MSDTPPRPPRRRPSAFSVGEPAASSAAGPRTAPAIDPEWPVEAPRRPRALPEIAALAIDPDDAIERADTERADEAALLALEEARPRRRGFSFGKLFLGALGALASIGVGLALDGLVRDLFAREDWLGWAGVALVVLLLVGALGIVGREAVGLMRLSAVERERQAARRAFDTGTEGEARLVVAGLVALVSGKPETAEGRRRLAALSDDVIDGPDRIALAERELMTPLDAKARALVMTSARRVSVVTAVSPKAIVDITYVLFETVRLIRRMAELYGARPGAIGLVRLTRDVVAHLAVTGSIAIGDNIVGQVVGHGLAARLSARLGEGVVNGLLTARVGLAAMDLCRPVPFLRVQRPKLGDFVGDLMTSSQDQSRRDGPGR